MNEKQRIKSGDESENFQAGGDITVNQGLSYTEVKDVAMTVFENNFIKLDEQVEKIVNERAEKLINDYLERIMDEHPDTLVNTVDPDIRASIYEAQRDYARSGKNNIEKLLVDLLVERTANTESDFSNVVLKEALSVVSKLNKTQIDIVTVSVLGKYYKYNNLVDPHLYVQLLSPFAYLFESKNDTVNDYLFLSYLGCIDISAGSNDFTSLIVSKNLKGLTSEEEVKENISQYPVLEKMKEFWDSNSRKIKQATATPVGNYIATANINREHGGQVLQFSL